MSGARRRKVRADLLSNRLRSALAVASLAVGTTALGAMVLVGSTVDASFRSSLLDANAPHAVLLTTPMSPEQVAEVAAHPLVGQAEGRRLHQAQVSGPGGERIGAQLVAIPDLTRNRVGRIAPDSGAWPPTPGSIVVERASVAELGVGIGDAVAVEVPGADPLELTVSGTAFDASEVAPMLGGPVRGYVPLSTVEDLTGSGHLDALYLRVASEAVTRNEALRMTTALRDDVLAPAGVAVAASTVGDPAEHPAQNAVSFLTLAMQLLALLALAVAVALVVNTVSALLAQQRRQLGVMKAVGATTGQLTAQYLAYVLALAVAAIAVSVPLAVVAGRVVSGFVASLANIELEPLRLPLAMIVVQLAVGVLVPVGAVVLAVRRACRTTVLDTVTDRGLTGSAPARSSSSRVARPTVLAYRNAVRNRLRLGLTVLTVALCGAVGVGVLSTGSALGRLSDEVAGYSDYDVGITLTSPVALDRAAEVLGAEPAVESVEGWLTKQASRLRPDGTENDGVDLQGVPAPSRSMTPTLLEGRWLEPDDDHAVVINTHLADAEPDLTVGDEVRLEVEGHRQDWHVVGIASTTLVGPVAYVPVEALGLLVGEPGSANLLAVELASDADPADAAERFATVALDGGLPVADAVTQAQVREGVDSMFAVVVALLLVVGGVLGVVAVVGVAGTMTLSVVEQTREIGVLRTLGASTRAVRRLLLLQGLAVATAGAVLGILLSIPVALLLGAAIGSTLISAAFPFAFSWTGVLVWVVVALAIGALGATQPARLAARLTVRDTLAYE
jgi:putative ABC transport system permease protein